MSAPFETPAYDPWEAAYSRFETPEQEIRKFETRLKQAGAEKWPRDSNVVELFCGRGNGLQALERLGFQNLQGVDLSPTLLAQYTGKAKTTLADCRHLPFPDHNKDIAIVQGGLHHLPELPADLAQTLSEIRRVLKKDGFAMFVEPWSTPFLTFVHTLCASALARNCSTRIDALATMIAHERTTYERWLSQPDLILRTTEKYFARKQQSFSRGKWRYVGTPLP